ncbi:MAG: hypothetical protein QN157_06020 [Armatimonadota bacterium]|nr:hypothetical protein [Armatimonadota bacterium]
MSSPRPLNVTFDTKVQVRFAVSEAAVGRRLPAPWRPAPPAGGPHAGATVVAVFSEVLLRLDATGQPAPAAQTRHLAILAPAAHPAGERATFLLAMWTAHPHGVPGPLGLAQPAVVRHAQVAEGDGAGATGEEHYEVAPRDGGRVRLALRYRRGLPEHAAWPTVLRSAAAPTVARRYENEALLDVVRSAPAGVDRVAEFSLIADLPALADLLDGRERLVSITTVPWFVRREYAC